MKEGFITQDFYAAVPYGKKQLMVIFNGQQLEVFNTVRQAHTFIKKHRESNSQTGTVFLD